MKSLIDWRLLAIVLALKVVSTSAQSVSNSGYNVFGLGTLDQQGLVQYESMGYAAIGSRAIDIVNIENPAGLTAIRGYSQIFDVGVTYSQLSQKSSGESFSSSFGGLHDLNYWFRASPKTAFSVGISKFSDASYDILDSKSGNSANGRSDSRHIGEGGSSQVFFAGGYSPTASLHLGFKADFLFGSMKSDEVATLTDPATNLEIETTNRFVKTMLTGGLQYQFLLGESSRFIVGGTYRTGGEATLEEEVTIVSSTGNDLDSLFSEDKSTIHIPRKVGLGVGFESKSWLINFDYEFEGWSINTDQSGYSYRDRFITSFGVQYTKDRFSENLLNRIAFRVGGGVHSNYLAVDNQDYLSQYYTLGLGVPLNRGAASINLSYQLYSTGTQNLGLIKENVSTFSFNISIRDVWFRKRVFD